MTYKIITDEPDEESLNATVSAVWVIGTLEISVKDDEGRIGIILSQGSYALDNPHSPAHDEGYWVPPNVAYPIQFKYSPPTTVGSLRRLTDERVNSSQLQDDMDRLAYSMGLRDANPTKRSSFIEIKTSPRIPNTVNAYVFVRFSVTSVAGECLRNLSDPEGRKGYVYYLLDAPVEERSLINSSYHQRCEHWYLGKPLMSNVEALVTDPVRLEQIRHSAILVSGELFYRKERGIICVADLAGYGAALRYANEEMFDFGEDQERIAQFFRHSITRRLEEMASSLGTTQVQTAGDGFIAALPERTHPDTSAEILYVLKCWSALLSGVAKLSSKIRDEKLRIGSRMSLHYGEYLYGRISGISSFSPAFDGASIIEAARLEQALSGAMKSQLAVGGDHQLFDRGHYVVVSNSVPDINIDKICAESRGWNVLGNSDLSAKEFESNALILGLRT
ncbi:hypothetical protein EEB14_50120 [Rhodococcus sp. WS4]|nr:hypothetical protein EEB14_50120 [Rhodococcus sp. WS4]